MMLKEWIKSGLISAGRRLPQRSRAALFHFAFNCAPEEFGRFSYLYGSSPETALQAIACRGFDPKIIVDVGAYEGAWSRNAAEIWPAAELIMIEPNMEKRSLLDAAAVELGGRFYPDLLGEEDGKEVSFHVMETGSSIFPEVSSVPRRVETRKLTTLDSLIGSDQSPELLKIDAQGYELNILRGASTVLSTVEAVILEVSLIEINRGCPILHESIAFMYERGFVTYEILEAHRRPLDHALFQVDLFFCRENSALRADKRFRAD